MFFLFVGYCWLVFVRYQVGSGVVINASFSGELICFANDADTLYSNNKVGGYVARTRKASSSSL
jgi:hypothetical protein